MDVVERLRLEASERAKDPEWFDEDFSKAIVAASDEIESLRLQNEWLKSRIANLQLPGNKHDHDTREKFLLDCGMPALSN